MENLIFGYVVVAVGGLGIWAWLDRFRRRGFEPNREADQIFRCLRCEYVYTDDPEVDRSRCPKCGKTNSPVEF